MAAEKHTLQRSVTRHNFILAELLVAMCVFTLLALATVGLTLYILARQRDMAAGSWLRQQQSTVTEYIKLDTGLSSFSEMVFYPEGAEEYTAVAMPIIRRAGDAFGAPIDDYDHVAWTDTVIYHLFTDDGGETGLRRTVIGDRDNTLTNQERYVQLRSVVNNGDAQNLSKTGSVSTRTLASDVESLAMTMGQKPVDFYAESAESQFTSIGAIVIGPGMHTLRFECVGNHSSSSSYALGIDTLTLSQTGAKTEAEHLLPYSSGTGATPVFRSYHPDPGWSNGGTLEFPASRTGQSLEIQFNNDFWLEALFAQGGADLSGTVIKADPDTGDELVQLAGMTDLGIATGEKGSVASGTGFAGAVLRVLLPGSLLVGQGVLEVPDFRVILTARLPSGKMRIASAYLMEQSTGPDGSGTTLHQLTFNDAVNTAEAEILEGAIAITAAESIYSDWLGIPLRADTNYLVTIELADHPENDKLQYWQADGGDPRSYSILSADRAVYTQATPAELAVSTVWSAYPTGLVTESLAVPVVTGVTVSHPAGGTYTSRSFDTKITLPGFKESTALLSQMTDGVSVRLRYRCDVNPDMSEAVPWDQATEVEASMVPSSLTFLQSERYVQFQAVLTTAAPYRTTPRLHMVKTDWPGMYRAVDIAGLFTVGPDRGKYTVTLDGNPVAIDNLAFDLKMKKEVGGHDYTRTVDLILSPQWK